VDAVEPDPVADVERERPHRPVDRTGVAAG
jgi:hypothetical protein